MVVGCVSVNKHCDDAIEDQNLIIYCGMGSAMCAKLQGSFPWLHLQDNGEL